MGDDWKGQFDYLRDQTDAEVIYLPRTPEISTTQIKNNLNKKNLVTEHQSIVGQNNDNQ